MNQDSRHPYTYAYDYVRFLGGCGDSGLKLSRGDANKIIEGLSKVLHLDSFRMVESLSWAYQRLTKEEKDKVTQDIISKLFKDKV